MSGSNCLKVNPVQGHLILAGIYLWAMNEWMNANKREELQALKWPLTMAWKDHCIYYPSFIQNSNLKAVLFLKNPFVLSLIPGKTRYYLPVYSQSICTPRKYEFCVHFTWMHQHFVRADSPFSGGGQQDEGPESGRNINIGFNELQQFQELNPLLPIILKSSPK